MSNRGQNRVLAADLGGVKTVSKQKVRCGILSPHHAESQPLPATYVWNCMKYIDLNRVRARVVTHPSEWKWCGHNELFETRQRCRLLDLESILRWQDGVSLEEFIPEYAFPERWGTLHSEHPQTGADREPLCCKSVTYVLGINCNLCVRNGPDHKEPIPAN